MLKSTGLYGPHYLDANSIRANVSGIGPGAYALGRMNGNIFVVCRVGRSDSDLAERLQKHINTGYTAFKFAFYPTPQQAFEKECSLFHDWGGIDVLDNEIHPDRPSHTNWACPFGCVV